MPPGSDSPPFDPDLGKREVKKQTRRALLLILGVLFALLLTFVGLFLFYDVPMPDDSALLITDQELRPPPTSSPTARNPLADLVTALKSTRLEDLKHLKSKVRSLEPGTEAEARAFLATQGPAFAAFDTVLHHSQPEDWRWPELGTEPAIRWSGPSASAIQNLSSIVRIRSRLELADGDWEKSLRSLTDLIRFSTALRRPPGTLLHHLVSLNAQRLGESGLEATLTLQHVPAARLAALQLQLTGLEPDRANYQRTLRIEYRYFKETLPLQPDEVDLRSYHRTRLLEPLEPFLTKPGMSCTRRFTEDRAVIAALQQGWKEGLRQQTTLASKFVTQSWPLTGRLLSPNPVGDYFHRMHTTSTDGILANLVIHVAIHRQTVLQLALRRYELDHARLPDDLTTLVPQYLPEVPLDPFTDLPMKWIPATQVLYSTGEDFTDHGGTFTEPANRREPDLGMFYWWGPAAAKWREEERLKSLPAPTTSTKRKAGKAKPPQPKTPPTSPPPASADP